MSFLVALGMAALAGLALVATVLCALVYLWIFGKDSETTDREMWAMLGCTFATAFLWALVGYLP